MQSIWIFNGAGGRFPSGAFTSEETAKKWILDNKLTGILTEYPLDTGVYEWAIKSEFFTPTKSKEKSPEFIQKFSCAQQKHFHFENGVLD